MIDNEFYSQKVHGEYEHFALGDYDLENGGKLRGCRAVFTNAGLPAKRHPEAVDRPRLNKAPTDRLREGARV